MKKQTVKKLSDLVELLLPKVTSLEDHLIVSDMVNSWYERNDTLRQEFLEVYELIGRIKDILEHYNFNE